MEVIPNVREDPQRKWLRIVCQRRPGTSGWLRMWGLSTPCSDGPGYLTCGWVVFLFLRRILLQISSLWNGLTSLNAYAMIKERQKKRVLLYVYVPLLSIAYANSLQWFHHGHITATECYANPVTTQKLGIPASIQGVKPIIIPASFSWMHLYFYDTRQRNLVTWLSLVSRLGINMLDK